MRCTSCIELMIGAKMGISRSGLGSNLREKPNIMLCKILLFMRSFGPYMKDLDDFKGRRSFVALFVNASLNGLGSRHSWTPASSGDVNRPLEVGPNYCSENGGNASWGP